MSAGLSGRLPDFPWDTIAAARATARAHPDGICDLSVGTPVDPVPEAAIRALSDAAAGWAGYPTVWGTPALRQAIRGYMERRWSSVPLRDENVLPVIGTKELVAHLPLQLGVGPGDTVVIDSGPLAGLRGVFQGPLGPAERVHILVRFLGETNRAEVPVETLRKAGDEGFGPRRRRSTRGRGRRINYEP